MLSTIISSLLLDIIRPLCRTWQFTSPEMHELKKHLYLFAPGVYPDIMKWTTYPINAAQRRLYDKLVEKAALPVSQGGLPMAICHYWTEIVSVMDRCNACGYTGSMKAIPKDIGTVLWVGPSLHEGKLPCFNPAVVEFTLGDDTGDWIRVHGAKWPFNEHTRRPLVSSNRTQTVEYGEDFLQVSSFFFWGALVCLGNIPIIWEALSHLGETVFQINLATAVRLAREIFSDESRGRWAFCFGASGPRDFVPINLATDSPTPFFKAGGQQDFFGKKRCIRQIFCSMFLFLR